MENDKKGKFIAIEGGDGSGKGTVIAVLQKELGSENVIFTREPGGTKLSERIRAILQEQSEDEMCVMAEILLFNAARAEHIEKVIKPALVSGKHVITDRFSLSTLAYQIYGRQRQDYLDKFRKIDQIVVDVNPDLYVFLDVEPELAMSRVLKAGRENLSRFDTKPLEFYRMVHLGYIANLRRYNNKIIDVGDKGPQEVGQEALEIVKNFLDIK